MVFVLSKSTVFKETVLPKEKSQLMHPESVKRELLLLTNTSLQKQLFIVAASLTAARLFCGERGRRMQAGNESLRKKERFAV